MIPCFLSGFLSHDWRIFLWFSTAQGFVQRQARTYCRGHNFIIPQTTTFLCIKARHPLRMRGLRPRDTYCPLSADSNILYSPSLAFLMLTRITMHVAPTVSLLDMQNILHVFLPVLRGA
jgi:hypothetical protein